LKSVNQQVAYIGMETRTRPQIKVYNNDCSTAASISLPYSRLR
jgi:hypothetical protein